VRADRRGKSWWVIRVTLEPAAEEPISTVLWNAGTVGISSSAVNDKVVLAAYFAEPPDLKQLRAEIEAFLTALRIPRPHLIAIDEEPLVEEDWLQKWKEGYHPLLVGERFIIAPSWEKPTDTGSRTLIEIDPGMAFGTGTHASTQLCLLAIERYWRGGRFLDIGTGTGILAIAAAKLHPDAQIVAVDIDPIAIEVTGENLILNRVTGGVELRLGSIDDLQAQPFNLIVANLTARVIEEQLGRMVQLLAGEGSLILSGVLVEQEAAVQGILTQVGLQVVDRLVADEWLMLVSRK
jgi:ribosomal protein L11 methyltransferase